MATTSLSLDRHWETFIKNEVSSGRYGTARVLEGRKIKLEALRSHLAEGAGQASKGEFIDNFSMDSLINDLDAER